MCLIPNDNCCSFLRFGSGNIKLCTELYCTYTTCGTFFSYITKQCWFTSCISNPKGVPTVLSRSVVYESEKWLTLVLKNPIPRLITPVCCELLATVVRRVALLLKGIKSPCGFIVSTNKQCLSKKSINYQD